ncbi:hypothetical protein R3W88_006937 [Solanum pinnatisectum]|uniref:Uncharacterized protein n=1 Tax=Solanum pinnatisectum TaxID=50273 RepID=A0AAV9KGM2_9SOLN|nr:hypothetical protein R3W88_006937 [Solanum pinnatisectum]
MPLFESPHASFDRYMEDKSRVFKPIFPDNRGTQRLNEEEWRIRMEPIGFLLLTAWPVVNMRLRCKTNAKEYPSAVPTHTSMVLEFKITKWDLEGVIESSEFRLSMEGVLYPIEEKEEEAASKIMKNVAASMQHKVRNNLLADYAKAKFKKETPKNPKLND